MALNLLLPNKYKKAGWIILIPSFIAGVFKICTDFEPGWLNAKVFSLFPGDFNNSQKYFSVVSVNMTNTLIGAFFITGALLVGFTKEKNEDEYIAEIRLSSLLWAVLVNYFLLLVSFIFIYGTAFLNVMMYNMFTVLMIFIIRFNYILYKNAKSVTYEK
jgi:hypothetical protein